MPRKRPGFGHRRPTPSPAFRRAPRRRPAQPSPIRAWTEWLRHQYEPGYWVGTRIPPFLSGSRGPIRNGTRWALALPMIGLISLSWLFLVAGLVRAPDERQPVPRRASSQTAIDFHLVFPCWIPDRLAEAPAVGVSPWDDQAALISYTPRRPSYELGGLVPSRVGLYIEERREPLGLGSLLRLPGTRQRIDDIDVVVAPEDDGPSIRTVSWVHDGLRFEMGGAGVTTDDLLMVVQSTRQSCSRA